MYLVGKNKWQGWALAFANSAVVIGIASKTAQVGLIPANVICLGMYANNIRKGVKSGSERERETVDSGATER